MTPRRWAARLTVAAVLTAGLAGCGSEETPLQQEPGLADALAEVDAAAVADDDARLEEAVAGLVRVTDDAEQAGDLDADDADRIRSAAEALLAAAGTEPEPEPEPEPEQSSTTSEPPAEPETTTSSPTPPPEEDDDEDEDEDEDDDGPGKGQKPPKGKKGPKKP